MVSIRFIDNFGLELDMEEIIIVDNAPVKKPRTKKPKPDTSMDDKKPRAFMVEMMPMADIKPSLANERLHPAQNIEYLENGLSEFDMQKPIVIDDNNEIIAGHGIYTALLKSGYTHVNVVRSNLKGNKKKAFRVFDNKSGELSKWDDEKLSKTLYELHSDGYAIADYGFDASDYDKPLSTEEQDDIEDNVPDIEQNAYGVERGDIWQLGNHRIMCGDSTSANDVDALMDGQKTDITFTSPPYNAGCFGYDKGKSKYKKKNDDDLDENSYFEFLRKFTDIALDISDYVFFNNQFLSGNRHALATFFGHYNNYVKEVFPWIKNTAPPNVNRGVFTNRFEFFLCLEKNNLKKGFPVAWQGKFHNIIEGQTASSDNVAKKEHSATMPIYVPYWFLERLSFVKTIYEPFCGTGTTLIACEKTGCVCYGMEIDPHYCSVIIKRWEDYSGNKAVKI